MGQIYGDVLYYGTSMMEEYYHEVSYSRPETYYYWGYFIFLNAFWIFIPACKKSHSSEMLLLGSSMLTFVIVCIYQSYSATVRAFRQSSADCVNKKRL
jgi:cholestenol delta-isomerase